MIKNVEHEMCVYVYMNEAISILSVSFSPPWLLRNKHRASKCNSTNRNFSFILNDFQKISSNFNSFFVTLIYSHSKFQFFFGLEIIKTILHLLRLKLQYENRHEKIDKFNAKSRLLCRIYLPSMKCLLIENLYATLIH